MFAYFMRTETKTESQPRRRHVHAGPSSKCCACSSKAGIQGFSAKPKSIRATDPKKRPLEATGLDCWQVSFRMMYDSWSRRTRTRPKEQPLTAKKNKLLKESIEYIILKPMVLTRRINY